MNGQSIVVELLNSVLAMDLPGFIASRPADQCGSLEKMAALARLNSGNTHFHENFRNASRTLADAASHLLKNQSGLDTEYLSLVHKLLSVYSALLQGDTGKMDEAGVLAQKIKLFHDLLDGKIHSLQTNPPKTKFLGEYLVELSFVTREQLNNALQAQKSGNYPGKRVGDILQDTGIITRAQLDQAIELQMLDNYAE